MHIPVMLDQTIELLNIKPNQWYLDGTFGRGGHARAILEAGGKVIAFDLDQDAIDFAQGEFAAQIASQQLIMVRTNFADLNQALTAQNFSKPCLAGALFDLGMSSNQIDDSKRGFTFQKSQPLDMRMDSNLGVTAADLLNALPEKHLKDMFWNYAQETQASRIAHAIVVEREQKPFATTDQLVKVIQKVKNNRRGKLHPATKVFMALRMAVNTELENLEKLLAQIIDWLQPNGRLVFISFHEGEDRLVKQHFRSWSEQGLVNEINHKPLAPTDVEVKNNPRSRSARVRAVEKNEK